MNWEAIGATAELLGAIGVIASLVYLASQIRSNTRAVKVTSYQNNSTAYRELNSAVLADPELLEAISGVAPDQLLGERINRIQGALLNYFQTLHYQFEQGFLDADLWEAHLASIRAIVSSESFRARWSSGELLSISLRPRFRELVEELMSS